MPVTTTNKGDSIKVGGQCYYLVGKTHRSVTLSGDVDSYDSCEECDPPVTNCATSCGDDCPNDCNVTVSGVTGGERATGCNQTWLIPYMGLGGCSWHGYYSYVEGALHISLKMDVECKSSDTTKWRVDYYFCNYNASGYLCLGEVFDADVSSTCPNLAVTRTNVEDSCGSQDQSSINISISYL